MDCKKTSIVILTFNKLEYTKKCIDSIRRFSAPGSYELILVDNHSTDGTVEWLKGQEDIRTILNSENQGFPRGCNQGIEIADGDSVLLLNNDVIVTPNWLDNMVRCLYSSNDTGAVGVVTNNCTYQQIPVNYNNMDEMIEFARRFNISDPNKWEERLKLIGFCMLIKKEVVDKVGFLDERFSPGNYEDDDYSFRIRQAGYKLMLCRDTFIHHYGSVSFKDTGKQFSHVYVQNQRKFEEKWGFNASKDTKVCEEILGLIDKPEDRPICILDVGCACGANLLKIKYTYKDSELHGIERNKAAAAIASTFANIKTMDIEAEDFDYPENYFDYILFTDILEQLKDPWGALKKVKNYLKADGKILAGFSNIMNFNVVRNLINGNWPYEDTGILSKSHLRFFTLNEINKLFHEAGCKNLFVMAGMGSKRNGDDGFLQAICQLSTPALSKQFEIDRYYIRACNTQDMQAEKPVEPVTRQKTFVTMFPETENVHLTKDVGMIPYIMHKYYNYDSRIVCYENGEYPYLGKEVKGLKIEYMGTPSGNSEEDGRNYLIKNAVNIDVLHLFHLCKRTVTWIYVYKTLNPNGKVYLKLDANVNMKNAAFNDFVTSLLQKCTLISVETKELYEYFNEHWPVRVEYIPNGFYDGGERKEVNFEEKENIICTVGRIGAPEKASDTLIEAFKLASPGLPAWKLRLIGPVMEPFKAYLTDFFNKHPQLRDKISLTGEISDRNVLDQEYRKAKVFCLPSRIESFGLVFVEAEKNGCFIISSDILPAPDITDNQKYGEIFGIGNVRQLAELLVRNCNDDERLKRNCKLVQNYAYDNFYWVNICKKIDGLLV